MPTDRRPLPSSADFKFHDEAMRIIPIGNLARDAGRDRVGIKLLREKALKRTRVEYVSGNWRLRIDCSSKICPNGRIDVIGIVTSGPALTVLFAALFEDNPNLFSLAPLPQR